jgi:hypothetical protein
MIYEELKLKLRTMKSLSSDIHTAKRARDYLAEPASAEEQKQYLDNINDRDSLREEIITGLLSGDYICLTKGQKTADIKSIEITYRKNVNVRYLHLVHRDDIGTFKGTQFAGEKAKIESMWIW